MKTAPQPTFASDQGRSSQVPTPVWLALGLALLAGCGTNPQPAAKSADRTGMKPVAADAGTLSRISSTQQLASVPKSVFQGELPSGRDPFFPGSKRSSGKAGEDPLPLTNYLKLAGIRPGPTHPLALINRSSFAPGEEQDVSIVISNQFGRPEVQRVSIRCLEIREDSVIISIAGEQGPKELRMAQRK
jgi:hypothetical protein